MIESENLKMSLTKKFNNQKMTLTKYKIKPIGIKKI